MQEFITGQTVGGVLLLVATVLALVLANSALAGDYEALLHLPIGLHVGAWALELSLAHWINDGLMAVFFLLVGLEIRRELLVGELASRPTAMLPVVAAVGGAVVPAALYLALNAGGPGAAGWGVPMATDIAFTLGCLALLGRRVPFALKVFVTAVAIVDDLIAVLVIALFYSGPLDLAALGLAAALLVALWGLGRAGLYHPLVLLVLGVLVWLAVLSSGIHASIAGVLVAMTVPARRRDRADGFAEAAERLIAAYRSGAAGPAAHLDEERRQTVLLALERSVEAAEAPLQKLEHALVVPVNFAIVPLFALANAGIRLSVEAAAGPGAMVALGVLLGLVIGKPAGLLVASWLAVRLRLAQLPAGTSWRQMTGAGLLAGIGFTMAIFIANLAFGAQPLLLGAAKLGILGASVLAGAAGLIWLSGAAETGG
jgi:NhaA family Na+:H+ antiporter